MAALLRSKSVEIGKVMPTTDLGQADSSTIRKLSVQVQLYKTVQRRISINKELEDADPFLLLKFLQDENNSCSVIEDTTRTWKCITDTVDIRKSIVKFLKFTFHFLVVMGVLYLSAIAFAYLEHESVHHDACEQSFLRMKSSKIVENHHGKISSSLRSFLQSIDNISYTECDLTHLSMYLERLRQKKLNKIPKHQGNFAHLDVQKWFYFVIIATTTIGYGDVCPKTENGRIFYCCFSVIGIVLMLSLLKSCGAVLSGINKRFHQLVRQCLWPGTILLSDEFLSVVTMTLLFIFYLSLGILHDSKEVDEKHPLVDIIYFWIVSLTTVGFGDIAHSLEFEINHAYELTVYRVFGLSLVAGIIESIQAYITKRRETLQNQNLDERLLSLQKKIVEKAAAALPSSPFSNNDEANKNPEYGVFKAIARMSAFSFDEHDEEESLTENQPKVH